MDNKDNFDFDKLENKLKQLPKIEDQRSKEVIFQNIKKQMNTAPKKRRRQWLMPTIASATAAVLLFALIPMMLNNEMEEALPSGEEAEVVNEMFRIDAEDTQEVVEEALDETVEYTNYIPAILGDNLDSNQRVVTVPFLDDQANFIVPLSFIVRDDDTILNQIAAILEEYDPTHVGLLDTPLKGITMEEVSTTTVDVNIPQILAGSANETMLIEPLKMLLAPLGYEYFNVLVDGQRGVDIGQYGPMENQGISSPPAGYTVYENFTGRTFLIAGGLGEVVGLSLGDIIEPMVSNLVEGLEIEQMEYQTGQPVTISFKPGTNLAGNPDGLMLLEAILLTAKDFNVEEVAFSNTGVNELGPYNLDEAVPTNIYPNGIAFR
ncbi:hypothetical protein [Alkalihalobacterium elongatum]|uniref:hypothetical protein n=1 Tax=Alkalihalobacterium elongatum TaxID=2675466 RepID=UPI001C1FB7D8|nr:hypothetical protein [Alkalihalobacterium elongatum]